MAALVASATGYVHSTPSSSPIGNKANPKKPKPDTEKPSKIVSFSYLDICKHEQLLINQVKIASLTSHNLYNN